MKPLYLKGAATLAVAALAGVVGYQTATAGEAGPGKPSQAAAASWKVSHYSESLDEELTDVTAVSADEGWAIGAKGKDEDTGDVDQVLLHRTGGKWKPSPLPEGADGARLSQIEAHGADSVWLFGDSGDSGGSKSVAFRWGGKQWKSMPAPASLNVWDKRTATVLGPDDVWVLGSEKSVHHWNGTGWEASELPHEAAALSGSSAGNVWAVGYRETSGDGSLNQPAAMHFDGTAWKLEDTPEYHFPDPAPPEEGASLDSVLTVSENETWAMGLHTFNHGEGGPEPEEEGILLRWDGSKWKKMPAGITDKMSYKAVPDGAGGLVLSSTWHMTANGDLRKIAKHAPVPGRSGKVEPVDKKQKFWPAETVLVPGTRQVWSAGQIELGAYGDANFRRGAVLSYDTE